jgi:hypothetical protein
MRHTLLMLLALFPLTRIPAHLSYSGRNFGLLSPGDAPVAINNQTVGGSFGWADATDADWGDSHRLRAFRLTLAVPTDLVITIARNNAGTGAADTLLPAFSLFGGLSHVPPDALAHDGSDASVQWLVDTFGSGSGFGLGNSGKEGSFNSLGDWTIGNDPVYNIPGDPTSGIATPASLRSFTYIGHAADGAPANYGGAAGIAGDGNADGFVTATFANLAAGDYTLMVGGANYAAQGSEGPTTFPTFGFNASVQAIPEPSAVLLLGLGLALLRFLRPLVRR